MKAVWYTRQGVPAEVMQFGEQPTPHAGAGEVRVRLHAVEYAPKRGTVVVDCAG